MKPLHRHPKRPGHRSPVTGRSPEERRAPGGAAESRAFRAGRDRRLTQRWHALFGGYGEHLGNLGEKPFLNGQDMFTCCFGLIP